MCHSCRIIRYHLGTVLFGAFIIAAVQFMRAVVKYIEQQTKSKANQVQKAIFCAIQCCLKLLECCLDKLSKNAFIWVRCGLIGISSSYDEYGQTLLLVDTHFGLHLFPGRPDTSYLVSTIFDQDQLF